MVYLTVNLAQNCHCPIGTGGNPKVLQRCVSFLMLMFVMGLLLAAKPPAKPVQVPAPPVKIKPAPNLVLIAAGKATYQNQCSFCHQLKPITALPDLKAWTKLLYTSACPQFSLKLTDAQRKEMLAYIEHMYKNTPPSSPLN